MFITRLGLPSIFFSKGTVPKTSDLSQVTCMGWDICEGVKIKCHRLLILFIRFTIILERYIHHVGSIILPTWIVGSIGKNYKPENFRSWNRNFLVLTVPSCVITCYRPLPSIQIHILGLKRSSKTGNIDNPFLDSIRQPRRQIYIIFY